jgi:hypothetical protein
MPHRSPSRSIAALVVAACLAASWFSGRSAQALESSPAGASSAADALPAAVAWFWQALSTLGGVRPQVGCSLDPSGQCLPHPGERIHGPKPQVGCSLDPSGQCVSR